MDIGCDVALNEGKQALKELMDMASVLETPAYKRVLAARPGYPEFVERKWDDMSEIMWGTIAASSRTSTTIFRRWRSSRVRCSSS